jgi:hypothetical protein
MHEGEQGVLQEARRAEFITSVREELADDALALGAFALSMDGVRTPKEQAAALGVSNVAIWRARKRVLYAMQCVARRKKMIR